MRKTMMSFIASLALMTASGAHAGVPSSVNTQNCRETSYGPAVVPPCTIIRFRSESNTATCPLRARAPGATISVHVEVPVRLSDHVRSVAPVAVSPPWISMRCCRGS